MEELEQSFHKELALETLYFLGQIVLVMLSYFLLVILMDPAILNEIKLPTFLIALVANLLLYKVHRKEVSQLEDKFLNDLILLSLRIRKFDLFDYYNVQFPIKMELLSFEILDKHSDRFTIDSIPYKLPKQLLTILLDLYKEKNIRANNYSSRENLILIKKALIEKQFLK